jgi:EAL domain-containing protein (putative c-di-GMP-specific phosphodiesterase class I)
MSSDAPELQGRQRLAALAQIFAQRTLAALPTDYALGLAFYDAAGHAFWQSGKGIDEESRDTVAAGINSFKGKVSQARVNLPVSGGRAAVLLRGADRMGEFKGFMMIVTDARRLNGKVASSRDIPDSVVRAAREWGYAFAGKAGASQIATDPAKAPGEVAAASADPEHARRRSELQAMQLDLHAQRLAPLQAGARVRCYEVYVRPDWNHRGDSSPAALLQELEAQKLGALLDRRVLHQLVKWLQPRMSVWHVTPTQFTLNLATTTVYDAGFVEFVEHELKKAQLPSGLLAFEIDQALCRREPKRVDALANLLQRLGSGVVIDNFTLTDDSIRLLSIPGVSMVKIDRELSGAALVSRGGQARIAALAQMCRVMAVPSVAKNVEGAEEHALLGALGITFVQGFAFAAPVPIDAIDKECRTQPVDPPVATGQSSAYPQPLSAGKSPY